jgi:hypothetical protein
VATIDEIRAAIRTALKTIPNLRVPDRIAETVDPDAAHVRYSGTLYDSSISRGSDDLVFTIQVFTSKASDRGQDALYEYCDGSGARSIKAAIEADNTLGDVVDFAEVTEAKEPGVASPGGVEMYSVEIIVMVGVIP